MDRLLHEIARMLLDKLGVAGVRIHDRGVEFKTASGAFRIEVRELQ